MSENAEPLCDRMGALAARDQAAFEARDVKAEQPQDVRDGDGAVETIRQRVSGARFDEELIELEAQTLRAALAAYDAALAENARMREEQAALPGMLVAAWRTGWANRGQVVHEAMSRAEGQCGFFVEQFKTRADEWAAELADAAPQQPGRDTVDGGAE